MYKIIENLAFKIVICWVLGNNIQSCLPKSWLHSLFNTHCLRMKVKLKLPMMLRTCCCDGYFGKMCLYQEHACIKHCNPCASAQTNCDFWDVILELWLEVLESFADISGRWEFHQNSVAMFSPKGLTNF